MKKITALVLALILLTVASISFGESVDAVKYLTLKVGTTTGFSGNFFLETLSNNISDMDVRGLIHGYSPVEWDGNGGCFVFDSRVISGYLVNDNSDGSRTYTLALCRDLYFSDGTKITAADYAFSILLTMSPEFEKATGSRRNEDRITKVRIINDYQFSVTMSGIYTPYFYELALLDINPYPIHVIAPGCTVQDTDQGAVISGPFTAELLTSTLLGNNGYISHPSVVSGAYTLASYDGNSVLMKVNPYYKGNETGNKPSIGQIELRAVNPDTILQELANGNLDLVVRCTRSDNIMGGMQMIGSGDFSMANYARVGLAFISFCADKGPTSDVRVRQAISMCLDKTSLISQYVGGFGTAVDGYFGLGQWMYLMAKGTTRPVNSTDDWSKVSVSKLTTYPLNVSEAKALLADAGWNLNADGTPYDEETGGLRYKNTDGTPVPLQLSLYYPEGNRMGQICKTTFAPYLEEAGAELILKDVPMDQLLTYYNNQTERDCDMILLGTNLGKIFDPSTHFTADGMDLYSGIRDEELYHLTVDLRMTEPGQTYEYVRKWVALQEYRTSIAAEIPLYSNAYFDFYTSALQDYKPQDGTWTTAITEARLSDYVVADSPLR